MTISKLCVLGTIAIVEGIVIIALVASRAHFLVQHTTQVLGVGSSPLELALRYESPDDKFEEIVKNNREWIAYRPETNAMPILSGCAILQRTNYVRILIANGADVEEAVKSLKKIGADDAVRLIQQVQSELLDEKKAGR